MSLKIGASIVSHLSANAATLARKEHISVRVAELQEEQLSIHKQATAEACQCEGDYREPDCRSRGRACQGYVREGRRRCRRECADREGQTGWHVARESGPAQYGHPSLRAHRARHCGARPAVSAW